MKKITTLLLIVLVAATAGQVQAQSKAEIKRQHEKENEALVKSLLESGSYRFVADQVSTTLKTKPYINIATSNYYFAIKPEEIDSHLPYFGEAYTPLIGESGSVMDFKSTDFTYTKETRAKKRETLTTIKIKAKTESPYNTSATVEITLEVHSNGNAILTAYRIDRSTITYFGKITVPVTPEKR